MCVVPSASLPEVKYLSFMYFCGLLEGPFIMIVQNVTYAIQSEEILHDLSIRTADLTVWSYQLLRRLS